MSRPPDGINFRPKFCIEVKKKAGGVSFGFISRELTSEGNGKRKRYGHLYSTQPSDFTIFPQVPEHF